MQRAAIIGAQPWTWAHVHAASLELATQLRAGSTVCNLCASRAGFLVVWLAALRARCIQVLPPSGGPLDLASILQSRADAVVVVDDASLVEARWAEHARCLVHPAIVPAGDLGARDFRWSPDWESPCVRLYTSGSTGAPQAQEKSLGQLAHGAGVLAARLESELGPLRNIERIVCSVPGQHMFGLETSVMLPLATGIAVQEGRPMLPAEVAGAMGRADAKAAWIATPLHLRAIAQAGEKIDGCGAVVASTMQLAAGIAAQCEALVDAPVLEIYGSTETGAVAMRRTAHETAWRALDGVRLEPSSAGTRLSGGHFSSPCEVSDQVRLETDGSFHLVGRHSDMLKIAGRRASLSGLNQLLQEMPGLDDAAFFMPGSDSPTERLVLIYAAAEAEPKAMLAWLRTRIDPVFMPRTLIRVERLPRSAAGKVPFDALQEIHAAHKSGRAQR
jgi:acyl-coenzyme A synthetase/AMP-(fatty) acid ligase